MLRNIKRVVVKRMVTGSFQWCPAGGQGTTISYVPVCAYLNIGENFTLRVAEHGSRLPREVLETSSLETFKIHLEAFPCSLLQVSLLAKGWTQ